MIKSLYSGVTGLKTHNQRMDVIGNNISNVNTTAFKAGTVTFKDVYYQTRQRASGGDFTQGGVNPIQTGMGVQLGTVGKVMTQSGLTYSDSVFDMALEGSGFFQVMDQAGNIFYTRLGRFGLDDFGNLVDPNGNMVLGVSGNPTGVQAASQRINITIPDIPDQRAVAISEFVMGRNIYEIAIRAGQYGPGGNIGLTITHSNSPFAIMSGTQGLNVQMDLTHDYRAEAIAGRPGDVVAGAPMPPEPTLSAPPTPAEMLALAEWEQELLERISHLFATDLNEAIRIGGVNVDEALLPLEIEFSSVPSVTAAQWANNYRSIPGTDINLEFEVTAPGASGNRYEVTVSTVAGMGGVSAQWRGNVLEITLPRDRAVSEAEIQAEIARAGANPASTAGVTRAGDPAAGQPIINVRAFTFDATGNPVYATLPNPAFDPDIPIRIPDPTWVDPGDGSVAPMVANPAYQPPTIDNPAYTAGNIDSSGITNNMTLRIGMSGGEDSFFQRAFTSLSTMQLRGGSYQGPQTPDTADIFVDRDGVIYGEHPVHGLLLLGRVDIVDFVNPEGLQQVGTSYFRETLASGPAQVRIPQAESESFIVSGALEMSNVDLSNEFSDMIITQRGFQANSRIITVSDSMLEELVNLKR
ncbi:MAG: flagellar hook-basal body complex protein [Oscillospiraceae bacterium]|nr:flagellar hook-basal body complex protein [Oscillospiraceae bacterium]